MAYLVFRFLFTLEEQENSSPFLAPSAFIKDILGNRIGIGGAVSAVLDVVFLDPLILSLIHI